MANTLRETIIINGKNVEVDSIMIDGTTYLPLRRIAEALNMEVHYDEETKRKTLTTKEDNTGAEVKPLPPVVENKQRGKVWLDAGHSNISTGAYGNGIDEMKYVTQVVLEAGKILEANGVQVGYSRKDFNACNGATTKSGDLNSRCALANNFKADLFVSVHNNCFSNPSANGVETLIYDHKLADSTNIAKIVQSNLVKETGMTDRGIKQRQDLIVLNSTHMTAILIELGFISNTQDATKLKSSGYQQKLGKIIAQSIIDYLDNK